MKVCIVEDDRASLKATRRLFEQAFENIEIVTATNKEDALRVLRDAAVSRKPFDVVVIDLKIPTKPDGSGPPEVRYSVIRAAVDRFPQATVVAYTAFAQEAELERLTETGRVSVIEKTTENQADILIQLVRTRVGKRDEAAREARAKRIEAALMARVELLAGNLGRGAPRARGPRMPSLTLDYNALIADIQHVYHELSPQARRRIKQCLGLWKRGEDFEIIPPRRRRGGG